MLKKKKKRTSTIRLRFAISSKDWRAFTLLCNQFDVDPQDALLRFIYICLKLKKLIWPVR